MVGNLDMSVINEASGSSSSASLDLSEDREETKKGARSQGFGSGSSSDGYNSEDIENYRKTNAFGSSKFDEGDSRSNKFLEKQN